MQIGLAVCSLLFLILYLIFANFIYKKFTKEKLNFKNVFPFEIWEVQSPRNMLSNSFLFLSGACFVANYIIYVSQGNGFDFVRMTIALFAALTVSCMIALFFIPLSKLKEHFICASLFTTGAIVISALNLSNELKLYGIEHNLILLIPIIVDSLIILIDVIGILNPRLFDLNFVKNSNGETVRPKVFVLAFIEWLMIFSFLFSQLSFIVISLL